MNKHTPGPWEVFEPAPDLTTQVNATPSGIRIADVWCTDLPECSGNARLIAAAPDLLAAAEQALDLGTRSEISRASLRAAIRRARGEE